MRPAAVFGVIFGLTLAARLCHWDVLWVEECYPAAGALQVLAGDLPYRDFWFDKPPLSVAVHLLWGGYPGWPIRLGGALFVTLVSWLLFRFGRDRWSSREGILAAWLGAFFLTFDYPASTIALAPDLLMIAPHAAAVWLAWKGRPFASGMLAGMAMLVHTKGIYVLAACLLWQYRAIPRLAAGFVLPNALALGWMAATGALGAYWQQVWQYGFAYARDTFVENPVLEGARRSADWLWFHATLAVGSIWYWIRSRDEDRLRLAGWLVLSLLAVAAGWRFFSRYYFQLLPVMVLVASRGIVLLGRRRAVAVLALLVVPLLRFGPRYVELARDTVAGQLHEWRDLAMYQGSAEVARAVERIAEPGDTLFVWGYRPDIFVLTRLPAGTPYLDSQPLTGVIADRHLFESRPSTPDLARRQRQRLTKTEPSIIVDGLAPYNPELAIERYPDLQDWLAGYRQGVRLPSGIIYQRVERKR